MEKGFIVHVQVQAVKEKPLLEFLLKNGKLLCT